MTKTVSKYAHGEIKAKILSGKLSPGTPLNQQELARNLGVSIIPVRTALQRLSSEGLVTIEPHRGAKVTPLSAAELKELYQIRHALESLAIRNAIPRMNQQHLKEILKWLIRSEKTANEDEEGVSLEFVEANRMFHLKMYEPSGMPFLLDIIQQLMDRAVKYRVQFLRVPSNVQQMQNEHRHLWELIQDGDIETAQRAIIDHNRNTEKFLLNLLSS